MAGTLGGLLVTLGLDSTEFDSGLDKSEQKLKQLSITAIAVGTAIGEQLGEAVKKAGEQLWEFSEGAINAAAHLKDLSTQTGLAVESLAGLERVGKFSSTSIDDIAGASNRLNRSLLTSGEQSNAAARAVRALGLDFDSFKSMGPEAQLQAVAEAMSHFQDGTGKGAAAMALFGRSGATFLKFLQELGERGIATTATTTEMAVAAKEYEAQVVQLGFRMDDLKVRLGANLLPVMSEVAGILLDLQKQTKEWTEVLNPLTVVLQTVSVMGIQVATVFLGIGREIAAIAAQASILFDGISATDWFNGQAIVKMSGNWRDHSAGLTAISDAVKADGEAARAAADKAIRDIMTAPERAALLANPAANMDARDRRLAALGQKPTLSIPNATPRGGDATSEAERYLTALQKELDAVKALADGGFKQTAIEKALADIQGQRLKGLTPALQQQIELTAREVTNKQLLIDAEKLDTEQLKKTTAELLEQAKARNANFDKMLATVQAINASNTAAQREIAQMGLTTAAKADLGASYVAEEIAIKQVTLARLAQQPAAQAEYDLLQAEILALQQKRELILDKGIKQGELDTKALTDPTTDAMSKSIADGILDGFRKGGSLADVFLNELKAQFAKTVLLPIIRPIVEQGNDYIKQLLGLFGGGIGLDYNGGSYNSTGGAFHDPVYSPPMSGGGPVSALGLYRVNEKRTEGLNVNGQQFLLMGRQGGQIDNNPGWGKASATVNQINNIGQGVNRNELANGMVIAKEQAKAEILRSMRTNGIFSRAGA